MKLLTICFPTYGKRNELQVDSKGQFVVLAPDEHLRWLRQRGWGVTVVSLAPATDKVLLRSGLPLLLPQNVRIADYDAVWHMFRDPTQPEVLELLDRYFPQSPPPRVVINDARRLAHHEKKVYLRVLERYGLAPRILAPEEACELAWQPGEFSARWTADRRYIESSAFNNNRGDYPARGRESIVTEFIDNAKDGKRSLVRFGVAFGTGFAGLECFVDERVGVFKTGMSRQWRPYAVPLEFRGPLAAALRELGCDVCHVEAIPQPNRLCVIDINPYPTANGKTLSWITQLTCDALVAHFQDRRTDDQTQPRLALHTPQTVSVGRDGCQVQAAGANSEQSRVRYFVEEDYRPLIYAIGGRRVLLVRNPFGNYGDQLLERGTVYILRHFGVAFERVSHTKLLANPPADKELVIVCPGGGNVGSRFRGSPGVRRQLVSLGLKMILFPQSASDEGEDLTAFEWVFAREQTSLEIMRRKHSRAELIPDMALALDLPPSLPSLPLGIWLRADWESATPGPHSDPTKAVRSLDEYIALAGRHEEIITDRLHFAIAALLQGRKVQLVANAYHKIESMFTTWLHRFPNCSFTRTIPTFPTAPLTSNAKLGEIG